MVLCSSSGGVLTDLLGLAPWWERHHRSWIAVDAPDTRAHLVGERVVWVDEPAVASPSSLLAQVSGARAHLRSDRAELVVSAGTAVAVPVFLAARSLGVACWWLETLNLLGAPGRAARLCARVADRTLVQDPSLVARRRRSVLVGELS